MDGSHRDCPQTMLEQQRAACSPDSLLHWLAFLWVWGLIVVHVFAAPGCWAGAANHQAASSACPFWSLCHMQAAGLQICDCSIPTLLGQTLPSRSCCLAPLLASKGWPSPEHAPLQEENPGRMGLTSAFSKSGLVSHREQREDGSTPKKASDPAHHV